MTEQQPRASLGRTRRCSESRLCANHPWKRQPSHGAAAVAASLGIFSLFILKTDVFWSCRQGGDGKKRKKHPNRVRSCLRRTAVPWLTAQTPLAMPQGWGWVCATPGVSLQRGTPIPASPSFQPLVAILAGGAAPCGAASLWPAAGWVYGPRHPPPARSPFPTQGTHRRAALPAPSRRHRLLLSHWQRAGPLPLININTASAPPSPPF